MFARQRKQEYASWGADTRVLLIPPPSSLAEVATRWVRESPNRRKWPTQYDHLKIRKPKAKVFRKHKGTSVACLCSGTEHESKRGSEARV